jgi:hypothetical protein
MKVCSTTFAIPGGYISSIFDGIKAQMEELYFEANWRFSSKKFMNVRRSNNTRNYVFLAVVLDLLPSHYK